MPKVQKAKPTTVSSSHVQRNFGAILRRATIDQEHFIVERDGFPMIAIISAAQYETWTKKRTRPK